MQELLKVKERHLKGGREGECVCVCDEILLLRGRAAGVSVGVSSCTRASPRLDAMPSHAESLAQVVLWAQLLMPGFA